MRAVAYRKALPITDPDALEDVVLSVPTPGPRDLLVRVEAVSVNPVDTAFRAKADPGGQPRVLGFDAAGVVVAIGDEVTLFRPGDEVYYAGTPDRQGTNAEYHVVDERIAGPKPRRLSFAEAAALPLTTITAYETLRDCFRLTADSSGTLLILGGAGGVGSILIQLVRALTQLRVVATASRPESSSWARQLGAHEVVDHNDLVRNVHAVADSVDYIFSPHTTGRIDDFAALLRPGGEVTMIDGPSNLNLLPLRPKSISLHLESMFTRPLHRTPDMIAQHELLAHVAELIDAGAVRSTMTTEFSPINATTIRKAHELTESGRAIGKTVLVGF
ncbi:zinc-binding alcohol dehydrogenase family protein [Nocardia sp. CDC160]|uniref:zinc-binding alcohol dehydrogenase family protein n=1 Tax=Nocardia sp. CDC160 TaxID=3112166 RepID=UPI002DBAC587|nr:zinc-binding alcohol dehydrogenase family protein [Nocardia sp. CDC160]MEC3919203.1 zinc-binding alcohol dehydrogenase family protein [Nocardia sp. CDC160]